MISPNNILWYFIVVFSFAISACGSSSNNDNDSTSAAAVDDTSGVIEETASNPAAPLPTNSIPESIPLVPNDNEPVAERVSECNDGIDNDGDGLTDWQYDVGCYGAEDNTEVAGTREQENGWTTFDLSSDSKVFYVSSSDGNDTNDGLSPNTALATPKAGWAKLRDGHADFLLLKRGDIWRDEYLVSRFHSSFSDIRKSGRSASEKLVVSTYGDSTERPIFEIKENFIDQDKGSSNIAYVGLSLISYKKEPDNPEFDGKTGGDIRFAYSEIPNNPIISNIIIEDMFLKYSEIVVHDVDNMDVRRNTIYKSYSVGSCFIRKDSNGDAVRNENGNLLPSVQGGLYAPRPSGMYMANTTQVLIEENIFDHNGWNTEDVPFEPNTPLVVNNPDRDPAGVMGACATDRNHNIYLSDVRNTIVRGNLFTRASHAGIKVSGNKAGGVDSITIEDNVFSEGALGINMAGNAQVEGTHLNTIIRNNVFTDIGRSRPLSRNNSWGIWFQGNDKTLVENNLFVNPPEFQLAATNKQVYAFLLRGTDYNSNILIENNIVHNYLSAVDLQNQEKRRNISLKSNIFHNDQYENSHNSSLVRHFGDFSAVSYSANEYYSKGLVVNPLAWFLQGSTNNIIDITEWKNVSGEVDATVSTYSPIEVGRNIDSYAVILEGVGNTLGDFVDEARKQSRLNWRTEYETKAVSAYIREGYSE